MPELTGDWTITKLFGFPGYEAMLVTTAKHINTLRKKHGLAGITYKQFVAEIETEMSVIIKDSEEPKE